MDLTEEDKDGVLYMGPQGRAEIAALQKQMKSLQAAFTRAKADFTKDKARLEKQLQAERDKVDQLRHAAAAAHAPEPRGNQLDVLQHSQIQFQIQMTEILRSIFTLLGRGGFAAAQAAPAAPQYVAAPAAAESDAQLDAVIANLQKELAELK